MDCQAIQTGQEKKHFIKYKALIFLAIQTGLFDVNILKYIKIYSLIVHRFKSYTGH